VPGLAGNEGILPVDYRATRQGPKAIYYLAGLAEGFETIAFVFAFAFGRPGLHPWRSSLRPLLRLGRGPRPSCLATFGLNGPRHAPPG